MAQFQDFEQQYGPATECQTPGEDAYQAFQAALPEQLIAQWREAGWCSYGNGLLWLTDPRQFDGILEDWGIEMTEPKPLVFLRTAFGHLYFWQNGAVHSLDVHGGSVSEVTKRIHRIFTLLCDKEVAEKMVRASLYQEAVKRLGPPTRDECYAFEPALALGGPGTADTLRRVAIREHLGILAQLAR